MRSENFYFEKEIKYKVNKRPPEQDGIIENCCLWDKNSLYLQFPMVPTFPNDNENLYVIM